MNSSRSIRGPGAAIWVTITVAMLPFAAFAQNLQEEAPRRVEDAVKNPPPGGEIVRIDVAPADLAGVSNAAQTSGRDIYFGAQPTKEALEGLAKKGVKVVINLRRPEELSSLGFDEKSVVESNGMKYLHVPMGSELPAADALKPVFDALERAGENRVFMHCASGNRVGAVWALYEGARGGRTVDDTIEQGKKAGLRSPALEAAVRKQLAEGPAAK